jgi:hypothetical protein
MRKTKLLQMHNVGGAKGVRSLGHELILDNLADFLVVDCLSNRWQAGMTLAGVPTLLRHAAGLIWGLH